MPKQQEKIRRLRDALEHREGDRVPLGEFFWSGFCKRCRRKWGHDFDPYRHFDLDFVVITPNMDPRIQPFEIVEQSGEDIVVKTGFGATIRRCGSKPMPRYEAFSVGSPEEMAGVDLDDAADSRRFHCGGDDQINCVGDDLLRDLPPWSERVDQYADDFAVFGSVCEPYEYLWRIVGTENAMYWMATHEELFAALVDRLGRFLLDFTRAQIEAAKGRLAGMYIWGDVAYVNGMLFGANRWRRLFKPHVKDLIELCRERGLMTVYHGCGDAREMLDDLVEIGLDCYNPLEAKAGLDVVELKKQYATRLAFNGNIDVRELESGNPERIEREIRYKLQAARGGGYVLQSDHSISSNVTPESYELAIKTIRKLGNFPLRL